MKLQENTSDGTQPTENTIGKPIDLIFDKPAIILVPNEDEDGK